MASLSNAKIMGGIGAIFVFIPILGWILMLLALKEISEVVQDKSIFDNAMLAGIVAIVGSFIAVFLFSFSATTFGLFSLGFFQPLIAFWVLSTISAFFLKNSYDRAAQKLNNSSFATAGLLYLIGSLTTIVFVGFLILFIGYIFQIIAYFSINDQPPPPAYPGFQQPPTYPGQPSPYPTTPPAAQQPPFAPTQAVPPAETKFCFKCGAKIAKSADYCISCGAKQS